MKKTVRVQRKTKRMDQVCSWSAFISCSYQLQTNQTNLSTSCRQYHQEGLQHHQVHLGAVPDHRWERHQVAELRLQRIHRHLHRSAHRALHADQRSQEGSAYNIYKYIFKSNDGKWLQKRKSEINSTFKFNNMCNLKKYTKKVYDYSLSIKWISLADAGLDLIHCSSCRETCRPARASVCTTRSRWNWTDLVNLDWTGSVRRTPAQTETAADESTTVWIPSLPETACPGLPFWLILL